MAASKRRPKPVKRGRFITFEGGEGAGKSTQIKLLADRLTALNYRVIVTREPGGSPGAEIIRHVVLSGMGRLLGPEAEALLFTAARDDHVHALIKPALDQGTWVLCDRFSDSTRAYQGAQGQVDPALIDRLQQVTIGELKPDLTFILDLPVEVGTTRAAIRRGAEAPDRFEAEGLAFHQGLREAFLAIAKAEPERCAVINADASQDDVATAIWAALNSRLMTRAGQRQKQKR